MVSYTKSLKVDDPFAHGTGLGPIQNSMQYEKVLSFLADCKDNSYTFATGGNSPDLQPTNRKGYCIPATIIDNPPSDSRIVTEEPFGPIIPVQPWSKEDDVVAKTNDTKTGLGACIWSKDIERAERIARRLEVGSVYVNSPLRPDWRVYFSGHKESGIGGERGLQGLLAYCNAQAVHVYK